MFVLCRPRVSKGVVSEGGARSVCLQLPLYMLHTHLINDIVD